MADKKYPFRITKVGANHTDVDENGKRVALGKGDVLHLTRKSAADAGYNNLGLVEIHDSDVTGTREGDVLEDNDDGFEDHETINPKGPVKSPQGALSPNSDPAARDGTELDDKDADDADGDDDADDQDDDSAISAEELQALVDEVEGSKVGDGTFETARAKVLAADLFEAETLPETKAGVLNALLSLQKAE